MARNELKEINGTFSGADMIVNIIFPGCKPICIGNASTITYSTYRETTPVRTLGRINPKGFAKGPRTIAGTIIFTVIHKHIVNTLKQDIPYLKNIKKLKPCELPPFDLLFVSANEYGASAHMGIYGITVVDEGKIFSIEDMFTENTWSYLARDIDLLNDIGSELNAPITTLGELEGAGKFNANELVLDDDYEKMQKALEQMKAEQDALIDQLRQNSNLYVGNPSGWVPGQDIIVVPPIGTETWDPGDGDVDLGAENHPKMEIQAVNGHKAGAPKDDVWICVEFEIETGMTMSTDVSKFKDADVKLVATASDKSCGKTTTKFEIKDKKMTVKFINYQEHKPATPTITVGVSKKSFKVGNTEYVLTSSDTVTVENPTTYSKSKTIKFLWVKKGSAKDKESSKNYTFEMTFHANSYTSIPGISSQSGLVQYAFRDATTEALKGNPPSAAVGNAYQPDYYTTSWISEDNIDIGFCTDVTKKKIPKDKLMGSFNVCCTVKENGKAVTPTNHKKMKILCDYKCSFKTSGGETVVLDGSNANNNATKVPQEYSPILKELKSGGTMPLDDALAGATIHPYSGFTTGSDEFQFVGYRDGLSCIADEIIMITHTYHKCKDWEFYETDPRVPFQPRSKTDTKNKCSCGITHNKLTFELYNFRLYDPQTNTTVKNTGNQKSVFFRIANLTDEAIKNLTR